MRWLSVLAPCVVCLGAAWIEPALSQAQDHAQEHAARELLKPKKFAQCLDTHEGTFTFCTLGQKNNRWPPVVLLLEDAQPDNPYLLSRTTELIKGDLHQAVAGNNESKDLFVDTAEARPNSAIFEAGISRA